MCVAESPASECHEYASAVVLVWLHCILIVEVDPECDVL